MSLRIVALKGIAFALALSVGTVAAGQEPALDAALADVSANMIRADMRFLSDDLLEGRETGTRGYELAAKYVATQFEGAGLKPAGDGDTFYQDVRFRQLTLDTARSGFSVTRGGASVSLALGKDYVLNADPGRPNVEVKASLAFVGFGITAPEQAYDDYKGVNVKGKIVVALQGAPAFQAAVKAHYSAGWLKRLNAVKHGAVGIILLWGPTYEAMYPFSEFAAASQKPNLRWIDSQGNLNDYYPELKAVATVNMAAARVLFKASGHDADATVAAVQGGKPGSFDLGANAEIRTVSTPADLRSANVVAKLEGSDPALKSQYVIYTAHLDHLGIGTEVNGDRIYNGALDNASGIAAMLSIARALSHEQMKPRRSLLFLAVTGEEKGLLGSDYYARHTTVPRESIVANINMDEDVMLWPLRDVVALGAEHSSLGTVVNRATRKLNLVSSPDPTPDQVYFVRSDQYSFVRQGIPSLALVAGFKADDPAIHPEELAKRWEQERYHHPSDDMQQPGLDFEAGALYTRVALLCGWFTANDDAAPTWNSGDFFGRVFGQRK
jgi:Zn-dependent M28 family amino/carboxypeptidase